MPELNIPNLDKLIAHMEAQPAERINMGYVEVTKHPCGTCGCIVGHAELLWPQRGGLETIGLHPFKTEFLWFSLVTPDGWGDERFGGTRYPKPRVIGTLKRLRDHYLATGQVVIDWGKEPGEPGWDGEVAETRAPWAAPVAVEAPPSPAIAKPLPDSLRRFVDLREPAAADVES